MANRLGYTSQKPSIFNNFTLYPKTPEHWQLFGHMKGVDKAAKALTSAFENLYSFLEDYEIKTDNQKLLMKAFLWRVPAVQTCGQLAIKSPTVPINQPIPVNLPGNWARE